MYQNYVCRKCGHLVVSNTQPQPIRWSDGHVCYFYPEQPQPKTEIGKQVQQCLDSIKVKPYTPTQPNTNQNYTANLETRDDYLKLRQSLTQWVTCVGGKFYQDKVNRFSPFKVYRYLKVKHMTETQTQNLYNFLIGFCRSSNGIRVYKSRSLYGRYNDHFDSVSISIPLHCFE